jgi:hypothetical protein
MNLPTINDFILNLPAYGAKGGSTYRAKGGLTREVVPEDTRRAWPKLSNPHRHDRIEHEEDSWQKFWRPRCSQAGMAGRSRKSC